MSCPSTLQVHPFYLLGSISVAIFTSNNHFPNSLNAPLSFARRHSFFSFFFHFLCPLCFLSIFLPLSSSFPRPSTSPTSVFPVAGNVVEEPDIHLILEYPSGASWGRYTSRRANRYVLVEHLVDILTIVSNPIRWTVYLSGFKPETHFLHSGLVLLNFVNNRAKCVCTFV